MRPTSSLHTPTAPPSALEEWRRDRLIDVGLAPAVALEIARDPRYDLHALLVLTDRGCDPELAVRIITPLDEELARC